MNNIETESYVTSLWYFFTVASELLSSGRSDQFLEVMRPFSQQSILAYLAQCQNDSNANIDCSSLMLSSEVAVAELPFTLNPREALLTVII